MARLCPVAGSRSRAVTQQVGVYLPRGIAELLINKSAGGSLVEIDLLGCLLAALKKIGRLGLGSLFGFGLDGSEPGCDLGFLALDLLSQLLPGGPLLGFPGKALLHGLSGAGVLLGFARPQVPSVTWIVLPHPSVPLGFHRAAAQGNSLCRGPSLLRCDKTGHRDKAWRAPCGRLQPGRLGALPHTYVLLLARALQRN